MTGIKKSEAIMDELIHYKKRVYYAQNREDLILRAFFPELRDGFYVDVGAYDPDYESVTKAFYKQGWRGINIEPQPDNYERFVNKRKRDINVNVGISNKKSTLTLRLYKNGGLSTFSDNIKNEYVQHPSEVTSEYVDMDIPVITLRSLFDEKKVKTINFMKVDVEGLEYEVLEGNDWEKYRPEVLCIESNHMSRDWCKNLVQQDYKEVFFDGLNKYFVDTRTDRLDKFDYVTYVVLERGGGLRIDDFDLILRLKNEVDGLVKYAQHLRGEVEIQNEKLAAQTTEITSHQLRSGSIRLTSRHLLSLLKKRTFSNTKRPRT